MGSKAGSSPTPVEKNTSFKTWFERILILDDLMLEMDRRRE